MTYSNWIQMNRQKFIEGDYDLRQILELSLAIGSWTVNEMKPVLHHWPRGLWVKDPEEGCNRSAKMGVRLFESTLKRLKGLSLEEQWSDLGRYLTEGKEWEA